MSEMLLRDSCIGQEVGQDGLSKVPSSSEILRLEKEKPNTMNKPYA